MKKLFIIISSLTFLLFVSCDNFMNGSDVQNQLEQLIDVANAKSNTILISNDTTQGAFLSSGEKECKVGYSIDLQFSVKKDSYIFKALEAVNKNSPADKLNNFVKFEETSTAKEKEDGIYKYKVTLLEESDNILIQPVCILIPKVNLVKPELIPTGYDQDEIIQITFNKAIDSTSNQFENFNNISIFSDNSDLKDFFDEPYLSGENKILNLRPKQNRHILAPDSNQKMNVTVSVDLTKIKDSDGLFLQENLTHTYRINDSFGNQKKSTLTVKEQIIDDISTGYFDKDGDFVCTVNYNIDLQFNVKKSSYVFQGLKATHKDGTPFEVPPVEFEVISKNESTGSYKIRVLVKEESNDILIKPDCVSVPKISSMTPEYDYDGVQQDTTISLTFNKPVTSVSELEFLNLSVKISDPSGQNLAQYFDKPYFSSDSTILYIPTVKTQRILKEKNDKKDIVIQFDLSGIKDEFGNTGSGFYQNKYRINGKLDEKEPTLSAVNVYSEKDKKNQLLGTPFSEWPASNTDKTNYFTNHVKNSVYVEMEGSDADSGIARARVSEKLIRYSDGSTATTQTTESAVEFIEKTDDGKYCLVYDMKSTMDGIVELTFNLEDYAGNLNKSSEAKQYYVLKDTLVESNLLHFAEELSQLEVSEESWLSVAYLVEGDTQDVKLTSSTNYKDTFYPGCTSDYTIEGFWGYSKDNITNEIAINREKGEYTFTREVSKFVYIKLIVSDEIGNSSEVIKYMDPRPEFNTVNAQSLQSNPGEVQLSLKGLDATKLLANKKIAGAGGKGGDSDQKTYTQYVVCVYDSLDAEGKPVGQPTKKMHFESVYNSSTSSYVLSANGNNLSDWSSTSFYFTDGIPLNKLIRIYAVSFCGDFLSPMTSNYVEYMFDSVDEHGWTTYKEGREPRLSNASDSSDIYVKDTIYEYGPYIKETVKLTIQEVKNAGVYKVTIDDYKTEAALAEENIQYQFMACEKWTDSNPEQSDSGVADDQGQEDLQDVVWYTGQTYTSSEPEFYLPAIHSYSFYIMATGRQGSYVSVNLRDKNDRYPMIETETGISFYLDNLDVKDDDNTTTAQNILTFSGDITPPNVPAVVEWSDPFYASTEAGSINIPIAEDESGLYKNEKGNYELTYYLIPATGSSLQTSVTYTLEELNKNYTRYKRTIEYSIPDTPEGAHPDMMQLSIPMGNEKGGVYSLVVVYEDIYHNANVVSFPCVNRLLGDLTFTQSQAQVINYGYHDEFGYWHEVASPDQQGGNIETETRYCQQLAFTLGDDDYVKVYQSGLYGNNDWQQLWDSNQYNETSSVYKAWNPYEQGSQGSQGPQGAAVINQWLKICGYKKTDSTFEMGFYNTRYYYLTDTQYVNCNSKNALTGLNGIQIFFDNPILVHTMFFKDYIPDDIDKTDYRDWERRGAETGVLTAKPATQTVYQLDSSGSIIGYTQQTVQSTATYSFKDNYKGVPSGCYYRTIIHFADGDVIMSDIKYKE